MLNTESKSRPLYLLTGSTGLVGRYLLARLLRNGHEVAAVARGSARESARQRIEAAVEPFEKVRFLQRPWAIDGDLKRVDLGLDAETLRLLRSRPIRVIHCAASIRFMADSDSGEPYATNVAGTQNLLDLCRSFNVIDFHHVSTAYVGSRLESPEIPEAWVDDPGLGGNDYERSKITAEQMVRNCTWIRQRVIHRPSIVVGDSTTHYTSTFHGFYAPLQIGCQFASHFGFSSTAGDWFRQQLGLSEDDSKNLIPVDWLAENVISIATSPPLASDEILHWTNPLPVPCATMQAAIVDAIEDQYGKQLSHDAVQLPNAEDFRQQMQVYESYFQNDPTFSRNQSERRETRACPQVDYHLLKRLAEYAIGKNFGWPKPPIIELPHAGLSNLITQIPKFSEAADGCLRLELLGPGAPPPIEVLHRGGSWLQCGGAASHRAVLKFDDLEQLLRDATRLPKLLESGSCALFGTNPTEMFSQFVDFLRQSNLDT